MITGYENRFLTLQQFIGYCSELNIKTDENELEDYEKNFIFYPIVRLSYPLDFIHLREKFSNGLVQQAPELRMWRDFYSIYDRMRFNLEDWADLTDDELVNSFDRQLGKNSNLTQPSNEIFRPWSEYQTIVGISEEYEHSVPFVEHFYSYWQVHHLFYIQQFPDLYKNRFYLNWVPDDIKKQLGRPWSPNYERLKSFDGRANLFDALSFWIEVYKRERNRTFSLAPEKYHIRKITDLQYQQYKKRLSDNAKTVQARFALTNDSLFYFLKNLLDLHRNYQNDEHIKLAAALSNDILYLTDFISNSTNLDEDAVSDQLAKMFSRFERNALRNLVPQKKELDEAHRVLQNFVRGYCTNIQKLGVKECAWEFSEDQIEEFLTHCKTLGLELLLASLAGMIATSDELANKFRPINLLSNFKNISTIFEFFLKDIADRNKIQLQGRGLHHAINALMRQEKDWFGDFSDKANKGLTQGSNQKEFFLNFSKIEDYLASNLSENSFWARTFLVAALARNFVTHSFTSEYHFYTEDFLGQLSQSTIYCFLYSWQVAKRKKWV